jgi:hypothetical protein
VATLLSDHRRADVRHLIAEGDATRSTRWMREILFGKLV